MNIRHLRPEPSQKKVETRWNYQQKKDSFIGWVNTLGIERTWAGRLAHKLDSRFNLRRALWMFLFTLGLSFLITFEFDVTYNPQMHEGQLVQGSDIRSPLTFEFVDEEQTDKKRVEAELSVPPVYDSDDGTYIGLEKRVHSSFREMRSNVVRAPHGKKSADFWLTRQGDFERALGATKISERSFLWLVDKKFNTGIETSLVRAVNSLKDARVMNDLAEVRQTNQDHIIMNLLEGGGGQALSEPIQKSEVTDIRELRRKYTSDYPPFAAFGEKGALAMGELMRSVLAPNLTLNKQETEYRKQKARESVSSVIVKKRKGEVIVHSGVPIQASNLRILDEIRRLQARQHKDFLSLTTAIFLVTILLCFLAFINRFVAHVYITIKDALAMGSILVVVVGFSKFFLFLASAAFVERFTKIPASFYVYLMPMSAATMMVGLLIPFGEVVWLFSVFASVVVGLIVDMHFIYMITTFTSGIVAARGVYGCKKRDQLYIAGIKTGLINAVLIFCATLILKSTAEDLSQELIWNTGAGFLSGIFAAFLTLTMIPLWETIFNYTTDVKLLELSNLNHPLLKDLIVKAPGTYHHSLVVGSMCEAAAEGIGANPLLAKVTCYYHDIGKMNHAQYFIENQRPGENKHDQVSPGMSKTILVAHVKDGVDMGIKFKLGKPIIDVISQHHGTTLISFFYQRAKEQENPDMHHVTEEEYRYPGPKPQFREAALCMLADSIEAAARCLDEPTPARLQSIVRNIVQKKFLDAQLDECDLTLKDLTTIEEAFSRILLGIYHHRIDYPTGPATKSKGPTPPIVAK